MRAIVVDDEAPARRRLVRLLAAAPDVEVIGEAADADGLLALLTTQQADVVFLDIRMPGLDGISLARTADLPPVVFTTAYADHAVEAFDVNAVDYLVKPIRVERLVHALDRVRKKLATRGDLAGLLRSIAQTTTAQDQPLRVTATNRGETHIFDARTITRFWSAQKYTCFSLEGREYETEEPLNSLEVRLAPINFVRVHRAELVNASTVRTLRREIGGLVLELTDGQVVSVSRRYASAVRARLGA